MIYLAGFVILGYLCCKNSKNQEIKDRLSRFKLYDTHTDRHRKVLNLP